MQIISGLYGNLNLLLETFLSTATFILTKVTCTTLSYLFFVQYLADSIGIPIRFEISSFSMCYILKYLVGKNTMLQQIAYEYVLLSYPTYKSLMTLQPISTKHTQYIQQITNYPGEKNQLPNFNLFGNI
mgnify:CR=1 FL=1